ncbi:hypothetical protein [Neobacillus sp. DY30]|uniref:hypothetical protein n=1 Tax=Neobacillus sp. DY30 TaxID=3047871 RepID=UPI0024C0D554|nr:hypothetical protein [Neobacillus sp. DY30]WHY01840.1 hypothetical protein QNH29_06325 [Neobacillus sp. DY30]
MSQPFEYSQIFYNEVIYYLETKWQRRLTDHEKHVLIEGYRFGRLTEAENEIRILEAK